MTMSLYIFLLTSLLFAGCGYTVVALPQDFESDQTALPDFSSSQPTTEITNNNNDLLDSQSSAENGEGNFVLEGNEQSNVSPTPITLLNTATEIRQYLVSKLREIYRNLKGCKSKMDIEQATLLDIDHLPKLEDPLYVGNFTKKYKLADVSFFNVVVRGMNNFRSADVHTDLEHRNVDLHLVAPSLQITGNYFLSNLLKKTNGPFSVKLCDNVTYHESSIYCRMKQEVDIAASKCGIRYGKSENDYSNLGWFTQLFRGAISNPMIDEVLQKVGKEIGHKMRPILLSTLQKTVIGNENNNDTVVPGLATLIRSTVSEIRNLLMKDEYKNFELEGDAKKIQYGTHNGLYQTIELSGFNTFEISELKMPVFQNLIVINLTVHDSNIKGKTNMQFEENDAIEPKTGGPANVAVPFEIEDLRINILLEKQLLDDQEKFVIALSSPVVMVSKVITYPPEDSTLAPQIAIALRDFVPDHLKSILQERLEVLVKSHVENILNEAALEQSDVDNNDSSNLTRLG